jgi:hypothetical protein
MYQTSDNTFKTISVDYLVDGGARISWELQPSFQDALSYSFQLQANNNGGDDDGWVDVGSPVVNAYYAIDSDHRMYGKDLTLVYRVVLTTSAGTYTSPVAFVVGNLTTRQWLLAQRNTMETFSGYLMKRKVFGEACDCVDPLIGGVGVSDHLTCYGTGIVGGYWHAASDTLFELQPQTRNAQIDPARGTVDEQVIIGKFIGLPAMSSLDMWIDAASDRRYIVHAVKNTAEMDQVPLVVEAEMALAPYSSVVYQVPRP